MKRSGTPGSPIPPLDRAPEVRQKRWHATRRRSPEKPFIVFHQPALEEPDVFFLERLLPMMLLLVEHVMPGGFQVRRGDDSDRAPVIDVPKYRAATSA